MVHEVLKILQDIENIGVTLDISNDKILYNPRHILDANPNLKARLVKYKKEIITYHLGATASELPKLGKKTIPNKSDPKLKKPEVGASKLDKSINSNQWNPVDNALIDWFTNTGQHLIPDKPFQFTPWQKVLGKDKFVAALLSDIKCGPSGPRAQSCALQEDLARLNDLFGSHSTGEKVQS